MINLFHRSRSFVFPAIGPLMYLLFLLLAAPLAKAADNASFTSQSVPTTTMVMGQTYTVSIVMKNNGDTKWIATGASAYTLTAQNPAGNQVWGISNLNLTADVSPAASATFTGTITAPSTPGTYNFQWQMRTAAGVSFGALTTNVAIQVGQAAPTVTMTSPNAPLTLTSTGVPVDLRITGVSVPKVGGAVGSVDLFDNGNLVLTSVGAAPFDKTVALSAGMIHRLKLRVAGSNLEGYSAEVPVTVSATGQITNCAQQLPATAYYTVSRADGPVYGNNVTGYNVGSDVASALVHSGLLKLGDRAYVTATSLGQTNSFTGTSANGVTSLDFDAGCAMSLAVTLVQPRVVTQMSQPTNTGLIVASSTDKASVTVVGTAYSRTSAGANLKIRGFDLYDGGTLIHSLAVSAPSANYNQVIQLAVGRHTLKLVATNEYGQFSESATIAVTVAPNSTGDGASFVTQLAPIKLRPNEAFVGSVTMLNSGSTSWTSAAQYRLGAVNPENSTQWVSTGRVNLAANVSANQIATIPFTVHAPSQPGTYNLQWRMLKEPDQWFGDTTANQVVIVEDGPIPTVKLAVTPANPRAVVGGIAPIYFNIEASSANGKISTVELWKDLGKGPLLVGTYNYNGPFIASNTFGTGSYQFWVRARDVKGVLADSDPVAVVVAQSTMMGELRGVRTGANGNSELYGWACMSGVHASASYSVWVDGPDASTGGVRLTSGIANVSTEWDNFPVQYRCGFTQTPHHFVVPLDSYISSYQGHFLYVNATSPDGKETVQLYCAHWNCNIPVVPDNTRVKMTTPLTGDKVVAHVTTPLRMVVTNADEAFTSIGFMADGNWIDATPDGTPGGYVANYEFWPTAENHTVFARVEQGGGIIQSMEQFVKVVVGNPTAKLSVSPTNVRVNGTAKATLTFTGSGSEANPLVSKVELFQDSGTGFSETPIKTVTQTAATVNLNFSSALAAGMYKFKLRATDVSGAATDSTPVVVNITNSALLGTTTGVRIETTGKPQLVGWMCQSGVTTPLNYQLLLDAPATYAGGKVIASGIANVATEADDAAIRTQCNTPGASHHFAIDLSDFTSQYPGRQMFVYGYAAGGTPNIVLPCADNTCTMPGTLRVGITTPTDGQSFVLPNPAFLRLKATGLEGALDEAGFYVNGTWVAATAETDSPGAYSASKALSASATPYVVYSKIRQGNTTLFSAQNKFYVLASSNVTMTNPSTAKSVVVGTVVPLSASVTVSVQSVKFFANGTQIGVGVNSSGSWNASWTATGAGNYLVTARSYDASGKQLSESASVTVTVTAAVESAGLKPVVISAPHLDDPDAGTLPGELSVTAAGAAAYSIPIVVPPGTAGLVPALALNYNSSGGNGQYGLGWSLTGLSSIHRCGKTIAQDLVNDRIRFATSDRLCLDGQRLILVNLPMSDANYWADGAEYRTEIDSFSRITAIGQTTSGNIANRSFKVETRDGRVMTYGSTADSAVAALIIGTINSGVTATAPTAKNGAQSWAVDKITDRSGNYIRFSYYQVPSSGEHRPDVIRYGGKGLAAHAAVQFSYEARADAWKRYIDESRNDLRSRVTHIKTYAGTNLDGAEFSAAAIVRDYTLEYELSPTSGRSLLKAVQVSARNPQSGQMDVIPKTSFLWGKPDTAKRAGFESKGFWPGAPVLTTNYASAANRSEYFAFSDFENHGRMDVLEKRVADPRRTSPDTKNPNQPGTLRSQYRYFHNNGSGFTLYNYKLNTGELFAVLDSADFDGDGAPDLLVSTEGAGPKICLSPLGKPGGLGAAGGTLVFTCDPNRPAVGDNVSSLEPYVANIMGDGRSAIYSQMSEDGTDTVCIQSTCIPDLKPPKDVLAGIPGAEPYLYVNSAKFISATDVVDFTGVGKSYDVRWTAPSYVSFTDAEGKATGGRWLNLQPRILMTGFHHPSENGAIESFAPYAYDQTTSLSDAGGYSPYVFDFSAHGGRLSGDFNGTGYSGVAYSFYNYKSTGSFKRAEMTLCLSTGRALDCAVRKKYSDSRYLSIRAVADFVGDGQPKLLAENASFLTGDGSLDGGLNMCRVTGDDTTGGTDDSNIQCDPWSGLTHAFSSNGAAVKDQVYLMDLLGTGRMQLVLYHSGKFVDGVWAEDGRWEVFAPIDVAKTGQALDRIYSVVNGFGRLDSNGAAIGMDGVQSVEYADGLTSGVVAHTGDTDLGTSYPQHVMAMPGKVVRKIVKDNGRNAIGNKLLRTQTYQYADAAMDLAGRGALGFGTVVMSDEETGQVVTTKYSHLWPYVGMVRSETVTLGNTTLSSTVNAFDAKVYSQAGGARTVYPYVKQSVVAHHDGPGDAYDLGTVTTDSTYDDEGFGNLTSRTVTAVGGGESYVENTATLYQNDLSAWLIGLPTTVRVTRANPDGKQLKRTTDYEYDAVTGLLKSETIEKDTALLKVRTDYARTGNAFGLISKQTQTWADPVDSSLKSRDVTTIGYDDNGRFQTSVTNAAQQTEIFGYAAATGVRISHQDINQLKTSWTSDGFGRVTSELQPNGNERRISKLKQCVGDCRLSAPFVQVMESYHDGVRISLPSVSYSDSAGHVLSTQSWDFAGTPVYVDRDYDRLGRLERTLQAAYGGATVKYIESRLEYDELSRVTKSVTLDEANGDSVTKTEYQGLMRVLTNALQKSRTERYNVIGKVSKVTDALNGTTLFEYDPFGNLTKTTDPAGHIISVEYDLLGRRLKLIDPDLGEIRYVPDPLGRVVVQSSPELRARTDGKTSVKMIYDNLDRMTSRIEPDLSSYWQYDTATNGKGKLAEAYTLAGSSKDYSRLHTYDAKARPLTVKQTLGIAGANGTFQATQVYDEWSRLSGQVYQRGTDASKSYDLRYNDKGYLATVLRGTLALWNVVEQDAAGRVTKVDFGNGTTQTRTYSPMSTRLTSAQVTDTAQNQVLQEGYGYDAIGNVLLRSQAWAADGPSFSETFHYDELSRLDSSTIGASTKLTSYFADGNIKSKAGVSGANYRYGVGSRLPHAIVGFEGEQQDSFNYDLNGNLTKGIGRTVTWTSFDMPLTITKGGSSVGFVYGPEHQRTRQIRGSDGTIYAGAQEVETTGGVAKVKTYWPLGLGVEIDTAGAPTALYWMHKDRLGSPVAVADQNGTLQDPLAYDAWGKRRSLDGASTSDGIAGRVDNKGFTGHEMLDSLDLVHMNGRVYDPFIARFLSADPHVTDPHNGQNYNRYSYVSNNPTNLTDPTGFDEKQTDAAKSYCQGSALSFCGRAVAFVATTLGISPDTGAAGNTKNLNNGVQSNSASSAGTDQPNAKGLASANNTDKTYTSTLKQDPLFPDRWIDTAREVKQSPNYADQNVGTMLEIASVGATGGLAASGVRAYRLYRWSQIARWNDRQAARNRADFEKYKDALRAEMEKPHTENPALSDLMDTLYRENATVGSGSTAAAVRQELETGMPVGGAFHSQKAQDSISALQRWLSKNPAASPGDRAAAENVIQDMSNALRGK